MIRSLGNRLCKNQLLEVDGQRRADKLRREDANKTEPAHSPGNAKYENKNTEREYQKIIPGKNKNELLYVAEIEQQYKEENRNEAADQPLVV